VMQYRKVIASKAHARAEPDTDRPFPATHAYFDLLTRQIVRKNTTANGTLRIQHATRIAGNAGAHPDSDPVKTAFGVLDSVSVIRVVGIGIAGTRSPTVGVTGRRDGAPARRDTVRTTRAMSRPSAVVG